MDGSSGPPSDVTAMGSENDEGSKVRRSTGEDSSASSPSSSGSSASGSSYPRLRTSTDPEYRGQGSIRAGSAFPVPTTSSSTLSSSSSSSSQQPAGCGCVAATVNEPEEITINITPTTGGQFGLTVDRTETVENLKKIISKRLKVAKERICLLYRERQLREGTLEENRLQDGCSLTLLPSVETGLLAQRPEQSVMQALESLNDSQVNDFLSGKAPLNLTMRLGDHMMLIQLQLSTVTPASSIANQTTNQTTGLTIDNRWNDKALPTSHFSRPLRSRRSTVLAAPRRSTGSTATKERNGTAAARIPSLLSRLASALNAAASCSTSLSTATTTTSPVCSSRATTASSVSSTSYLPISPPHSSFCSNQSETARASNHGSVSPTNISAACQSCLLYLRHHHHLHHHHHHHHSRNKPTSSPSSTASSTSPSPSPTPSPTSTSPTTSLTTTPTSSPTSSAATINATSSSTSSSSPSSATVATVDHLQQQQQSTFSTGHGCADSSMSYDALPPRKKLCSGHHHTQQSTSSSDPSRSNAAADGDSSPQSPTSALVYQTSKVATLDTRALAEASRNLTQKLKQLSSEENARRQGAIIENMHHHGKGVYSGTFSGTLNPALQDPHGRPKRDISTIIHILNDLLCAAPVATAGHYRHHYRHSNGRQQSTTSTSSTGTTTTTHGSATPIGWHDSSTPGYSTEELLKENAVMKGKMRRLRLVMEERRAKRKARRQARAAPYTTQWAAVTPDPDPNHDPNTSTASSSTAGSNTAEPQNEPELQPCSPEPVVA